MIKGEIEKVETLFRTQDGTPSWWAVRLKGRPEEFALHQNWMALHGDLNPGDRVRYVVSKAKLEGCLLFEQLRKLEEEMVKLVEEGT